MSEKIFTEKQLSAIETRDRTLLVSAAAGSGKTATLTERIIRSILDERSPESIGNMLIVTYTNAAVNELRDRIGGAIRAALEKNPDNEWLSRQLLILPSAKIMTIDAFCGEILRENAESIGINASFRMADKAEATLLSSSIMNSLISAVYDGLLPEVATAEEFDEMADSLTDARGEGELAQFLLKTYGDTQSVAEGVFTLGGLVSEYNPQKYESASKTRFGKYIIGVARAMSGHYSGALSEVAERLISGGGENDRIYAEYFFEIGENIKSALVSDDLSKIGENLSSFLVRRRPMKSPESPELVTDGLHIRDTLKTDIEKIRESFFLYSEEEWADLYTKLYKNTSILYKFLCRFDELFMAEKKRMGMFEFLDVERFALNCLVKDGEKTDYAKALSDSFSSIYIDEYQDINRLQHEIFEAVSRDGNRFMVGDIKQSIYSFRSAAPSLFSDMKSAFPELSCSAPGGTARIFMSDNFRSDRCITEFVNSVFHGFFSALPESISYAEEDRLVCKKIPPHGDEEHIPTLSLIRRQKRKASVGDEETERESASMRRAEAERICELVKTLLANGKKDDGSPVRPSDIAIILRNAKGRAAVYSDELERAGIPAEIRDKKSFLLNPEILITLCLLNSIDNPYRDVYLTGLLASPILGFSADELVEIRRAGEKDEPMYESLKKYAEGEGGEKARRALERLGHYRKISEGVTVGELLTRLYRETGLFSLAARNGGKKNLTILYDYAKKYESSSYKGLYSFINYINTIIDENAEFNVSEDSPTGANAVKITTAHSSKGLEYPIVIFAESDAMISGRAEKSRLFYAENFGIAMLLRSQSGLAIIENPVANAINHYKKRLRFEEELRVLYVILTRARERLFIVGGIANNYEEKILKKRIDGRYLSAHSAYGAASYLDVILTSGAEMEISVSELPELPSDEPWEVPSEENAPAAADKEISRETVDELIARFNFEYPGRLMTKMPEKLSVSRLSPAVLDGEETGDLPGEKEPPLQKRERRATRPAFISGERQDESALRGIATHNFLQFCDFSALKERSAEDELERLVALEFISRKNAELVRLAELEKFRRSDFFSELLRAKRLLREFRFNVLLPAPLFTESPEAQAALSGDGLLVQGVIDCIIENEGGELILVDYKTDRLSKDELSDEEKARRTLSEKHALQLGYYSLAIEQIFGRAPRRALIYSLHLGRALEITPKI